MILFRALRELWGLMEDVYKNTHVMGFGGRLPVVTMVNMMGYGIGNHGACIQIGVLLRLFVFYSLAMKTLVNLSIVASFLFLVTKQE